MRNKIKAELKESIAVKSAIIEKCLPEIETAAQLCIEALKSGHKIIFCGNGGSAADAQHLAAELIGRFLKNRKALPAIALTTNSSILTCLANDFGYETIFARQIEGLAMAGDIVIGISTSGNSKNITLGFNKAKEIGCKTIGLLGYDGGPNAKAADLAIIVPGKATPRIQESHITIGHIICGLIEEALFLNA
ncbi:phosphoheptose isomerase [candidate division WOR-1 bacterium RIFCSPLOWO2_02_FULL_46_20]|uniref:Phosphoheptose isomerase n=2 Tax=Saganbacteria TaxID=1703751 RepID=A0A1F4R8Y6_UNCSA|nr:MAG: phosphoheptose isomerase [candidate division WOR-1 bacterium RIFCSPHIGHO2_02_FULL_45_12]OGC04632.1 MAG: phosphoheptose isomerase [candidate division WOR-1 bacterium RIFCSPLOWO2_02_FULL_46_20]OGC08858.1 MAG: phosphoheptose isomerase [candidate division WOR-1 bacterium RIFCSPLOWO2_12_FULL_45_9]